MLTKTKKAIWLTICLLMLTHHTYSWGFYAHKLINRLAVYSLPPEMFSFYKYHIQFITENAVNPDRRRMVVEGEEARHYIDIDVYGDSAVYTMPRYWSRAVEQYTEDTLLRYGIVPWHINKMKYRLTDAMSRKDVKAILRLSADIGHYIADANVPLHTTENYNGQLTGQRGIHGFWESRLPELFSEGYSLFVGKATYIQNTQLHAWDAIIQAHLCLDEVLGYEMQLTEKMGDDRKYSFEERNGILTKVYSRQFSDRYHQLLDGQVEERMRASAKMAADFWYTCWVDAGQPELDILLDKEVLKELSDMEKMDKNKKKLKSREEE